MSASQGPAVFRSNVKPALYACVLLGMPLILVAEIQNQIRSGRFPTYANLIDAGLVPIFLAGIVYLAGRIFTVKVLDEGLRCYDEACIYRTVAWHRITDIERRRVYGLPYLYIRSAEFRLAITLPLWLEHMPAFVAAVQSRAGSDNPLTSTLRAGGRS